MNSPPNRRIRFVAQVLGILSLSLLGGALMLALRASEGDIRDVTNEPSVGTNRPAQQTVVAPASTRPSPSTCIDATRYLPPEYPNCASQLYLETHGACKIPQQVFVLPGTELSDQIKAYCAGLEIKYGGGQPALSAPAPTAAPSSVKSNSGGIRAQMTPVAISADCLSRLSAINCNVIRAKANFIGALKAGIDKIQGYSENAPSALIGLDVGVSLDANAWADGVSGTAGRPSKSALKRYAELAKRYGLSPRPANAKSVFACMRAMEVLDRFEPDLSDATKDVESLGGRVHFAIECDPVEPSLPSRGGATLTASMHVQFSDRVLHDALNAELPAIGWKAGKDDGAYP